MSEEKVVGMMYEELVLGEVVSAVVFKLRGATHKRSHARDSVRSWL